MLSVYGSVVFVCCVVLILLMTAQLFYTANVAATKLDQGCKNDTGIFPKRTRNVNAWYRPAIPLGEVSLTAYPLEYGGNLPVPKDNPNIQATFPARIGYARTTECPIFRAQDNGSTNPLLIG